MTTVIVEPHSDDAWLSLGQHLLDRAFGKVAVVTVYGDEARAAEAEKYATTVAQGRWTGLFIPEGGQGNSADWVTDCPPLDRLSDAVNSFGPTRIIGPLGLRHPEHLALREAMNIIWGADTGCYVELPYALVRKNADLLNKRLAASHLTLTSAKTRTAAANAAAHIFKSQSMFWHYNREKMVGAMELVLGIPR